MKTKEIGAHLDVAARYAKLSTARRLQVGAVVVKDNRIISIGYNGTPPGWDNNCEEKVYKIDGYLVDEEGCYELQTKPEVIHAEENAIAKLARSHESGEGAAMFITHAPCRQCAKLILVSGITSVYYRDTYRDTAGIKLLQQGGIAVQQVPRDDQ